MDIRIGRKRDDETAVKEHITAPDRIHPFGGSRPAGRAARMQPKQLRHWADNSEWCRAAVNHRRRQVSQSQWSIAPVDPKATFDPQLQAVIELLFLHPNSRQKTFRELIEPMVEDILVLDRGVCEKEQNVRGLPVALHLVDGGTIRTKPLWDGEPTTPRYEWWPNSVHVADLLDTQIILMMENPSSHRVDGFSPMEALKATIDADLEARDFNKRMVAQTSPVGMLNLGENAGTNVVDAFRCFDDKTEVLTQQGWKLFAALLPDDLVAAVDPDDHSLRYERPTEHFAAPYRGWMIHFEGQRGSDVMVTPNHRVLYRTGGQSSWLIDDASTLVGRDVHFLAAPERWDAPEVPWFEILPVPLPCSHVERAASFSLPISMDDWLEFLGYFIAEGSANHSDQNVYCVAISQVSGEKADQIQACLDRLPFHASRTFDGRGWRINNKALHAWLVENVGQGARNKKLPDFVRQLGRRQLSILFAALMLGDGRANGRDYTTSSRQLADDVQEIVLKIGRRAWISRDRDGYEVHAANRNESRVTPSASRSVWYEGMVYCATVPSGLLLVRRNGKSSIQGNSYWDAEVAGNKQMAIVGGVKNPQFIGMGQSARDMQYMQWQVYLLRKIAAVFGIAPQDLGVTFDINRANASVQQELSEDRGFKPLLRLIEEQFNTKVIADFTQTKAKQLYAAGDIDMQTLRLAIALTHVNPRDHTDVFVKLHSANILNLAFKFRMRSAKSTRDQADYNLRALAGIPWRTPNEIRAEDGDGPVEGGDKIIVMTPIGAMPMDMIGGGMVPQTEDQKRYLEGLFQTAPLILGRGNQSLAPVAGGPVLEDKEVVVVTNEIEVDEWGDPVED